jgi:hypothetical protein
VGLFKSKTQINVSTTVSRVLEDKMLPNSIKTALTNSLLGGGDLIPTITEGLIQSIGNKADRMYDYGESGYIYGLPSGQTRRSVEGTAEVEAVLATLESEPVALEYSRYGPPNSMHIGWMELAENYDYDPATNILGTLSTSIGHLVYLEDMVVVMTPDYLASVEAGVLDQWGASPRSGKTPERAGGALWTTLRAHTHILEQGTTQAPYIKVDYIWATGLDTYLPTIHRNSFVIPLTDYDDTADYFHAKYSVGDTTKYWIYQQGAGTFPELDTLFNTEYVENGTYFPFAYFRFNQVPDSTTPGTPHYTSTKKLMKYLNLDYENVNEALNSNPDIADVHQAIMMMGVPPQTTIEEERRYLFDYFNSQYEQNFTKYRTPQEATLRARQERYAGFNDTSIVIQDARFQMALSHAGVLRNRKVGTIATVGKHDSGFSTYTIPNAYQVYGEADMEYRDQTIGYFYYRRQINKFFYDEILVMDLRMVYYIYGGYGTTADELNRTLLVPIDRSITEGYSTKDKEVLYGRSLHFIFNAVQITKIKWYQTGLFRFLLIVAAIAITVINMGADGGTVITALLTGTAAEIGAALVSLISSMIPGLLINLGLQILGRLLGPEAAFLLAVATAVLAIGMAVGTGSLKGTPWASELLRVSSGLVSGGQLALQKTYKELANQFNSFKQYVDQTNQELETAKKLLENDNHLSPFVIFGESPDDYYNRTVHSGNIGVSSLSAVSSYVDIALTLPKLDDTLRGEIYE